MVHEEKTHLLTESFSPTGSEYCYLLMKPRVPRACNGKDHRILSLAWPLEIISPNSRFKEEETGPGRLITYLRKVIWLVSGRVWATPIVSYPHPTYATLTNLQVLNSS